MIVVARLTPADMTRSPTKTAMNEHLMSCSFALGSRTHSRLFSCVLVFFVAIHPAGSLIATKNAKTHKKQK
jgi:hypothetical protein